MTSRTRLLCAAAASVAALAAGSAHAPRLVWNASASARLGLYWVTHRVPAVGDFVLAAPPPDARRLAAARAYLPATVDLVKRIAAISGSTICAVGRRVLIDGNPVAERLAHDGFGRPLPAWTGCRTLAADEVFLLMANVPDSFDGRYFGPTPRSAIVGTLVPLWTFWPVRSAVGGSGEVSVRSLHNELRP